MSDYGWQSYPSGGLAATEKALFEAWDALEKFRIPICGIGPLLVLKLNAFAKRQNEKKAKDAYDILVVVSSYSRGAAAAIEAFEIEKQVNNPAMAVALETLTRDFIHPDGLGPRLALQFRFGSDQDEEQSLRLQTDLVAIAQALLGE